MGEKSSYEHLFIECFQWITVLLTKLTQDYFSVDDTDFLKKMIIANYLLKSR